ncbi:MAG: TorF family putative porin [Alphaproteobacteria bacterium]
MYKHLALAAAVTLFVPQVSYAGEEQSDGEVSPFSFSANTALVSDYVFRGISQSDENVALQGGFDIGHDSGLYAGLWASSIDFNDNDESSVEVDIYAGYSGEISDVSYDVGGLYYAYPGADSSLDYDFFEVYGSLAYDLDIAAVSVGVNYSPDYFGGSGDAVYTHLGVDVPLPYDLALSGGVGYQTIDDNDKFGTPDYTDWNLTLSYEWENVNFFVTYHDTDLDEPSDCADNCEARVVFGISTEFSTQ